MKQIISCKFNIDTACVELKFTDGSMLSIDTIAVENEVANNMYERSELDYLIYNDPAAYDFPHRQADLSGCKDDLQGSLASGYQRSRSFA